ncbi:MAG: paraquat-inducible protein A [Colwellia sp.]
MQTAKLAGLSQCPNCHKLNHTVPGYEQRCARCDSKFSTRKRNSLQMTIAWNITALIAFIPANLYPIMIIYKLGIGEPSTILSGIGEFVDHGLYPIAVIIFTASIIVPLLKIIGLFVLVYRVYSGVRLRPEKHRRLYNMLSFLGPWSMLDVFVVSLLVAVVELGIVTSVGAGPAINYFTMTVVFTMFAANSFDPRLLWDRESSQSKLREINDQQ